MLGQVIHSVTVTVRDINGSGTVQINKYPKWLPEVWMHIPTPISMEHVNLHRTSDSFTYLAKVKLLLSIP
jgi:hypothetical protein